MTELRKSVLKSIATPALLSFVVLISMLGVYYAVNVFSVAGVFVANLALHCLYEKLRLRNSNRVSTVAVIVLFNTAGAIAIALIISAGRDNMGNIVDWFFKGGDYELHIPQFTAALMCFFTPFISATVFYFTQVRYKIVPLMLSCLITFAIYAKSLTPVPFIYPALIIAAFLLIAVERRWANSAKGLGYRKFAITGICFVAAAAYIAALFPQAATTPFREQFDSFISQGRFDDPLGLANVIDSTRSGRNNPAANLNQVLFTVSITNNVSGYLPNVMRRQVFDTYTGEYWELSDEAPANLSMPVADYSNEWFSAEYVAFIYIVTPFSGNIIPTMPWTYAVRDRAAVMTNGYGQFSVPRPHRRYDAYTVFFREQAPDYLQNHLLADEYPGYIAHLREEMSVLMLALPDYHGRRQVRELALSLTRGLNSDFEKATALEQYFYDPEQGFLYDDSFVPASTCAYTFLFETRRGTCSDFASAMTV
ncbi:MAG: transglutaminaseTgpA domain-containing protein, partial [Oscillospiraceae bacterium]|nr:transglutaminaseTgpA domain-containing protein [Oscillospiraceae bacterium]